MQQQVAHIGPRGSFAWAHHTPMHWRRPDEAAPRNLGVPLLRRSTNANIIPYFGMAGVFVLSSQPVMRLANLGFNEPPTIVGPSIAGARRRWRRCWSDDYSFEASNMARPIRARLAS